MNPRYFWATLLIIAGILLLLNNLGILSINIWGVLWPLALILIGVGFLVGATRRRQAPQVEDLLHLEGATRASIRFHHGAGRLWVKAGSDPDALYRGLFGGGVERKVKRLDDRLEVELHTSEETWAAPWNWFGPSGGLDWDVSLNPGIPLALDFETGASQTDLDLSQLCVTDLTLKAGASATSVTLPASAGVTRAQIEMGAASVKLRVPQGVAARIQGTIGVGALSVDERRFPRRAGGYESDNFAASPNRVEIRAQGGVGSVEVT